MKATNLPHGRTRSSLGVPVVRAGLEHHRLLRAQARDLLAQGSLHGGRALENLLVLEVPPPDLTPASRLRRRPKRLQHLYSAICQFPSISQKAR